MATASPSMSLEERARRRTTVREGIARLRARGLTLRLEDGALVIEPADTVQADREIDG